MPMLRIINNEFNKQQRKKYNSNSNASEKRKEQKLNIKKEKKLEYADREVLLFVK